MSQAIEMRRMSPLRSSLAIGVVVNAMRFFAKEAGILEWGSRALSNITFGNAAWREEAKAAGARPQWLVGMADAMDHIEKHRGGAQSKTERLAIQPPQPRQSQTTRSPVKRAPKVPPKRPAGNGGAGKMVPLPDAGSLWR